MKKFSDIVTETILEKETQAEVNALITEGIVDGLKKIAGAGKDKLNSFKTTFAAKSKEYLTKTLSSAVKLLISSITSKKQVDIKSELEQNALFKEVLGETNAIEEVTSEFNKDAVKDVIGKKGEVISDSINQPITKNIITEDAFDSADTITTKIFSSVYKVISGALEKAGYIIKPEFRNWYDKCVRKVQKKFYASNLGKQIKDLPPEVEQDVMERFQAIIGIIVIVIMIWIISSTLNGDDVATSASGGAAAEEMNNFADASDARSDNFYNVDGNPTSGEISMAQIAKTDPDTYKAYNDYIKDRVAAIKEVNSDMDADDIANAQKQAALEFKTALQKGKVLSIEDNKIIEANTDNEIISNEYSDMTHNADRQSKYEVLDRKSKISDGTISFFSRNQQALQKLENNYVNARLEALQQSNDIPNEKIGDIKFNLEEEFKDAYYHGKILSIKDNKIVETNSDSFINLSNNIDTLKNIGVIKGHVADFSSVSPTLLDNISIKSFIKNGITDIKFIDRNINVNLEIDRIPKNMLNLNAKEIADKVIREYANAHRDNVLNGL